MLTNKSPVMGQYLGNTSTLSKYGLHNQSEDA